MMARRPLWHGPALVALHGLLTLPAVAQDAARPQPSTERPGVPYVDTTRPAVPGAQEVLRDLPNALHWARQQRGVLAGYPYVLFPDGTGRILTPGARARSAAELTCTPGLSCEVRLSGGEGFTVAVGRGALPALPAAPDLAGVARYLAQWLLAGTATPEPEPDPEPAPAPIPVPEPTATLSDAAPEPSLSALSPETPVAAAPDLSATDPGCIAPDPFMPDACALGAAPAPDSPPQPAPAQTPTGQTTAGLASIGQPPAPQTAPPPVSLVERLDLSCSATVSAGLAGLGGGGDDRDSRGVAKPRASFGCGMRLAEGVTLRTTLVGYFNPDQQQDWDPDYTYALTWRASETITLSYSNYGARFNGPDGPLADLWKGTLRASYRLPALPLPATFGEDRTLPCSASLGLPRPDHAAFSLSCSYAVTPDLRIGATTNLYMAGAQDTYQPDYTYTATYRLSDDWTVSYANYSNNRFPWNRGEAPGPGLSGGSLSVTYQMAF